jgi:hypothetical protein
MVDKDIKVWLFIPAKYSSWELCGSIKLTHTVCPVTLSTSCCRVVNGVLWLLESHRAVKNVRFRIDTGKFRSWLSLKFITRMLGRWPNSAGTSCSLLFRTLRMVKLVQLPISENQIPMFIKTTIKKYMNYYSLISGGKLSSCFTTLYHALHNERRAMWVIVLLKIFHK